MNVLSLFDGLSGGRVALERAGIKVNNYYSSEIDKYAIQIASKNYPQDDVNRLGDITKWQNWNINWSNIDLVTGGFPCQAWSIAGKQLGDKDERGMLFWTMLDIMKKVLEHNPKAKFLIENVKMKKEFEEYITLHTSNALGVVYKHLINSALVSAQNRERYYWTNIPNIGQLQEKEIILCDILKDKPFTHNIEKVELSLSSNNIQNIKKGSTAFSWFYEQQTYTRWSKTRALKAGGGSGNIPKVLNEDLTMFRKLTPLECERLQTLPDNYTNCVSNSQRYKAIGNGWTIDVIAHIFKDFLIEK